MPIETIILKGFKFVTVGYAFFFAFLILLEFLKIGPKKNSKKPWQFALATMPSVYFYGIGLFFIVSHENFDLGFKPIVLIVHIGFIVLMFFGLVLAEKVSKK